MFAVNDRVRVVAALALSCAMILVIAYARKSPSRGISETSFWVSKFANERQLDVVIAGDSRVLYGVSPEEFEAAELGKTANFGFLSAPMNHDYLNYAASTLKPGGRRIIVLGITANSFTPDSFQSNGFKSNLRTTDDRLVTHPFWLEFEDRLRPTTLSGLLDWLRGRVDNKREYFHENGWLECETNSLDEDGAFPFYRIRFKQNEVTPKQTVESLQFVRGFVERGGRVYGFRPPVPAGMSQIESNNSGFDYQDYKARFEDAGGIWLEPNHVDFQTFDGSHLESTSAVKFSNRLAELIAKQISK